MRTVITRFITFDAENTAPEVYAVLAFAYLTLLALCLASLARSNIKGKLAWSLYILFIPMVGMYMYTFWCLLRADYSFLARLGLGALAKTGTR